MTKEIKHFGILGMRWGRRMAKDGSMTTLKRNKRVPMITSVKGKKVQKNGRALSNNTRSFFKRFKDNTLTDKDKITLKRMETLSNTILAGYFGALSIAAAAKIYSLHMENIANIINESVKSGGYYVP